MKNKLASKSLLNSCLLATLASFPFIHTGLAQTLFPSVRVGDGTGSAATGDGTFVAEGRHNVSPLLNPTYQTSGSRMLWYARRSAFRVGYGNAPQWQEGAMGDYSFASGSNCTASGVHSTATGVNTTASGSGSIAMGSFSTASGPVSTALGFNSLASGYVSTALGFLSVATGSYSTAMGNYSSASGEGSTAMGIQGRASGFASAAMGQDVRADSMNSTAFGRSNVGGGSPSAWNLSDPLFEIGNGSPAYYYDEDAGDEETVEVFVPKVPSNALTVYKNGNMTLQGNLTLGGTITSDGVTVLTTSTGVAKGTTSNSGLLALG
ncbi:MAG: hypothetical protein ACRCXD_03140, partial [Luteolibacter sp.]